MKEKIMVVLCASSSINYIEDIRRAGYEPVILEPFIPEDQREEARKVFDGEYARIKGERPTIHVAKEKYHDTLTMVREIAPKAILVGTDFALELATNLAHDLGLPCNNPERLPYLREKDKMQEAAKAAGLRYIRGEVVTTVEDGVRYFKEVLQGRPAIVKPLRSAGSNGVVACINEAELREALVTDIDMAAKSGQMPAVLVQEMIIGTEYYINTVTLNGETVVVNVVEYEKRKIAAERPVYVSARSLDPDDKLCRMLMDYTVRVNKAAGLEIGPAHTEVMVDDQGPVLIEINTRLAGADQPAEWQDKVLGLHESDIALRAYLGKDIHQSSYSDRRAVATENGEYSYFRRKNPGCIHFAVTSRDIDAEAFIGKELIESLPGTFSYNGFSAPHRYPASKDFFTLIGLVFMVNESEEQLVADLYKLLDVEMNHIEKLFKIKG